jgi:hypothetical protein
MRSIGSGNGWFAAFFVLSLGVLGAQSQCARVADDVTAPTGSLVGAGGNRGCTDDCERAFKESGKEEDKRFKRNTRDCREHRRSGGEVACLQAEAGRHLAALQSLASAHLECIGACGGFASFDDCVNFCEGEGNRQEKDEGKIHDEILRACDSDACRTQENARHAAALGQIEDWVADSVSRCHDQGGGGAGQ